MLISAVYVRFYKSFNFDYLRKSHPEAEPDEWEMTRNSLWYPFVRIPIDKGSPPSLVQMNPARVSFYQPSSAL